jgi:hypothetical protein
MRTTENAIPTASIEINKSQPKPGESTQIKLLHRFSNFSPVHKRMIFVEQVFPSGPDRYKK